MDNTSKNKNKCRKTASKKYCFLLTIIFFCHSSFAQDPSDASASTAAIVGIETIAKRPGPPLWKVSNGTNAVWIFGIPSPYHVEELDWDRMSVRSIMAESEVFIPAPEVRQPLNPLKYLSVGFAVSDSYRIPNKGSLEDIISPELYARFLQVKSEYLPKDKDLLKFRPRTVGHQLYSHVLAQKGLVTSLNKGTRSRISKSVERMAKSLKLEIKSMHQVWEADDFHEVANSTDWNTACLESVLDSIEQDLDGIANRSHAWAQGDVSAYRKYDYPNTELACELNIDGRESDFQKEKAALQATWLEAIDETLVQHKSSFSTMGIDDLVRPGGLFEQLISRGYTVRIL